MLTSPRITVLVGAFNGEARITHAFESMFGQTLRAIEVIVFDDGSTDATADVVRGLAAREPRLYLETLGKNVGIAGGLNRGLELLPAPFVAIQDHDTPGACRRGGACALHVLLSQELGELGYPHTRQDLAGRQAKMLEVQW